ncbi:MAG: hypothetical protein C0412_16580 [Flavobacterium sp.]|nr:hypothetical protein [Flavobacterium sp.]
MATILKPLFQEFEELCIEDKTNYQTVYDEELNITVVQCPTGEILPAVNWNGKVNTDSETRIQKESSDTDLSSCLSTQTETYEHKESTDDDSPINFSTLETITNGKREGHDVDNFINFLPWIETATKIHKENTDPDEMS